MIEFHSYIRNPSAPRVFVNDVGRIYRLITGATAFWLVSRQFKALFTVESDLAGASRPVARGRFLRRLLWKVRLRFRIV